ncbi:MAG TPA: hypothetical protein VIT85_03510 [Solirubrobacterales bacterium]
MLILSSPDQEKSVALLRDAEICCVENPVPLVVGEAVSTLIKFPDKPLENSGVTAPDHPRHVLHDEVPGAKFRYEAKKMKDKLIPLVVNETSTDRRKALAGRAPSDEVDFPVPGPRILPVQL